MKVVWKILKQYEIKANICNVCGLQVVDRDLFDAVYLRCLNGHYWRRKDLMVLK